jgi:hypothetical protein
MKIFTRAITLLLPLSAVLILSLGADCVGGPTDDDDSSDDDDSAGDDTETDCDDGIDNDVDGVTDCDDPDCAADAACTGDTFAYVAVVSRTATQADIDINTPGPDIDAVELFNGLTSEYVDANSILAVPGEFGAAGNANDNVVRVSGSPDAGLGGDCDLAEEPNGKFWSMGGGDAALGVTGFFVAKFDNTVEIVSGDEITVYELGPTDCDNVATARDDDYEIFVGTSDVDENDLDIDSFAGPEWTSLGTTGAGGNIRTVTVP